jgi:hypothetical protein
MIGVGLVLCGLAALCGAAVWLFGPVGLAAGGAVLIVVGLVPDWERVHAVDSEPASRR